MKGRGIRALHAVGVTVMIVASGAPRSVAAQTTFVTPPVNLLYQNFPNPFPSVGSPLTCIWFDLAQNSTGVMLAIYDLRGRLVRTIVPSASVRSTLPAGYYGRAGDGPLATGCDSRFIWDGRGSDGVVLPSGVYLLRLHVDGGWQVKKIIFRAP